jgi:hypothetical protein
MSDSQFMIICYLAFVVAAIVLGVFAGSFEVGGAFEAGSPSLPPCPGCRG